MLRRDAWLVGGLSDDARRSFASLLIALDRLTEDGQVPPCRHPLRSHWWTSDDLDEREAAAHGCTSCPLLDTCAAHAPHERWHTWAGADRTSTRKKP